MTCITDHVTHEESRFPVLQLFLLFRVTAPITIRQRDQLPAITTEPVTNTI